MTRSGKPGRVNEHARHSAQNGRVPTWPTANKDLASIPGAKCRVEPTGHAGFAHLRSAYAT